MGSSSLTAASTSGRHSPQFFFQLVFPQETPLQIRKRVLGRRCLLNSIAITLSCSSFFLVWLLSSPPTSSSATPTCPPSPVTTTPSYPMNQTVKNQVCYQTRYLICPLLIAGSTSWATSL